VLKFIKNIGLFVSLLLVIFGIFNFIVKKNSIVNSTDYIAGINLKHKLVNEISSPKIIVAGGSNVAFGIDSDKLEEEFSIPVVNLGLHAGLGLDFILAELKDCMKENDIVLLSPEYILGIEGNYNLKQKVNAHLEETKKYNSIKANTLGIKDLEINLKKVLSMYRNNELIDSVQSNSNHLSHRFNKHGDYIIKSDDCKLKENRFIKEIYYRFWNGIDACNSFNEYALNKNVMVLYIAPSFAFNDYKKSKKSIDHARIDLENNLTFEILDAPHDFIYPDSLFYDTCYHLNKTGKTKRTNKLIQLLKNNRTVLKRIAAIKTKVD
jgi:hypothetical protein